MGQHYLNPLFAPKSVAVFGASDRIDSIGQIVFQNMLESGYQGGLYPINPKSAEIQGKKAYASIADIGEAVELVVIATPPQSVPDITRSTARTAAPAACSAASRLCGFIAVSPSRWSRPALGA